MTNIRKLITILCISSICLAQAPEVSIQTPKPAPIVGPLLKPFHLERRIVSPANLSNTPRLELLVRAGNLYLSAQDVIALALENNVDIAIQRRIRTLIPARMQSPYPRRTPPTLPRKAARSSSLRSVTCRS